MAVAQPAYGGCQVVAHLLDEFYLLIQEVIFQEVTEMMLYACRIQGMKTQGGLVQVLLQDQGGFHGLLGFSPLILRWPLHILKKCTTLPAVFNLSPHTSLWPIHGSCLHPPDPHPPDRNSSSGRGGCRRPTGPR